MKKKFAALLCGAIMAVSSVSFATVTRDQVMLGDIQPGMNINEVTKIYGNPLQVVGDKWIYKGFYIEIDDDRPNYVDEITTEDSGFATQEGIIVGMSEDVLNAAYGKADNIETESNGREYTYYSSDRRLKMEFKVQNGVITKIECSVR